MDAKTNKDRLLRGIRCLQLIQRTNDPKSTMAKACTKALAPLLEEMALQEVLEFQKAPFPETPAPS